MLKFFLVAHLTYENQWVKLHNKKNIFGFFGTPYWTAPFSILVFYFMTSHLWSRSPAPHTLTILQSENANLDFEAKRKKNRYYFSCFLPPWSCLLSAHGRPTAKPCSTWPRLRDESFYLWLGPLPPHGIVGPGCILGENIWTFPSLSFFASGA